MDYQGVISRLRELIDEFSGGRYSRFAEFTGVPISAFQKYLRGEAVPSMMTTAKICEVCGVTPNWLIFGWPPKFGAEKPPLPGEVRVVDAGDAGEVMSSDFVSVPILDLSAWRESGVLVVSPATVQGFTVTRSRRGARLVGIYMIDGSMIPELDVGDLVVADMERREKRDGDLLVANIDGLVTVRRFREGLLIPADSRRFGYRPATAKNVLAHVVEIRRVMDVLDANGGKNGDEHGKSGA